MKPLACLCISLLAASPAAQGWSLDGNGWTLLQSSPGTRRVYVAPAPAGNDNSDGLAAVSVPGTNVGPKATVAAGYALLRDGFADWLLLRDDGVWNLTSTLWWAKSGTSLSEPMVFGSYRIQTADLPGPRSARPRLVHSVPGSNATALEVNVGSSHVLFVDLHFSASDDTEPGIGVNLQGDVHRWLRFENLEIHGFRQGMAFDSAGGVSRDISVRRSVIVGNYQVHGGHSAGLYADRIDGLLIQECVFDLNGWDGINESSKTVFNHNIYINSGCSRVVVDGNISARACSHGIQLRPGGSLTNNLFLENPHNVLIGPDRGEPIAFAATGNVILGSGQIFAGNGGSGFTIQGTAARPSTALHVLSENVIAHRGNTTAPGAAIGLTPRYWRPASTHEAWQGVGAHSLLIQNNRVYDWRSNSLEIHGDELSSTWLTALVRNNHFQEPTAGPYSFWSSHWTVYHATQPPGSRYRIDGIVTAGNRFHSAVNGGFVARYYSGTEVLEVPYVDRTFAEWARDFGDITSWVAPQTTYPNAGETIGGYNATVAPVGGNSLAAFLAAARQQERTFWRDKYAGTHAAAHFRRNFGL